MRYKDDILEPSCAVLELVSRDVAILGGDFVLVGHEGRPRHDLQLVAFNDSERHVDDGSAVSTTTEKSGGCRIRQKVSDNK